VNGLPVDPCHLLAYRRRATWVRLTANYKEKAFFWFYFLENIFLFGKI
jgi:hypothetical protein